MPRIPLTTIKILQPQANSHQNVEGTFDMVKNSAVCFLLLIRERSGGVPEHHAQLRREMREIGLNQLPNVLDGPKTREGIVTPR